MTKTKVAQVYDLYKPQLRHAISVAQVSDLCKPQLRHATPPGTPTSPHPTLAFIRGKIFCF